MNILHVNTHDVTGGAGMAAHRLVRGLRRAGHTARMLVRTRAGSDRWTQSILPAAGFARPEYRLAVKAGDVTGLPDVYVPSTRRLTRHPWMQEADIVNLHNIHGRYFSLLGLASLSRRKPVVWTLHDMWALTGHCGYSFACGRWETGCGHCPALNTPPPLRRDTTHLLWRMKQRIYDSSRLMLVTPSRWLAKQVQSSPLLREFPLRAIPNSVDTAVFRPRDAARKALGLPENKFLLLFMAYRLDDYRKGGDLLHAALLHLGAERGAPPIEILLAGGGGDEMASALPFPVHRLGHITAEERMAAYYAAADLFILPSRQDNLPNGLLESIACSTPAIGFNVGGVGEVIRHQQTGLLLPEPDAGALAEAIRWSYRNPDARCRWKEACRKTALREYALEVQARAYLSAYEEIIG